MTAEQNTSPDSPFPPDAAAVELAVCFIEADPCFDGADSMKERLAAHLEVAIFTTDQCNRLAAVLLRALRHGSEAVFRSYARLAPRVTTPLFEAAVNCYAASCEFPVAERARHVLDVLRAGRVRAARPPSALRRSDYSTGRCLCAALG